MDINDYSTRLAQTRNRYNEASQELRDNFNERAEAQEKLHEAKQKNQRDNYIKQKLKMEEGSQARLERYDNDLQKALDERTHRYNKNLEEKQRTHDHDRKKTMGDYKQKLSSISKSFETANTEQEKLHKMYKDNMLERYEVGLSDREKTFNEKIAKVQRNSSDAINDFRDQTNTEKKELLTDHTNQKKQLVQDANISRNRANSLHQVEMERLREAAKQNESTLRNNFENSYQSLKATKNAENENQRETFEALTQKIQDRNTESLSRLNDNNKEEKRELEKNFANDRIQLERRTNSIINQGHASKVENTKKSLVRQHENQLANVREAVEENTRNNAILNERLATDQANVLKNTEVKHNMDLEAKDAEMRNLRKVEIGGLKERFESANELQSKRYRNLELQSEGQQVKARKNLTSRLDNQRMEFSRTLNQINQSNQEAMADARKEMAEEQSNFIENTKKMTHNEIAELKEDFSERMTKKEASLTSQLEVAKKENFNLAQKFQNKLDIVNKKAAKEMETLKQFENQRRLEDRRAAQRQLDLQQRDFEKNMNSLRREYDRRLNDTKAHNDVHVAKLTERYENQISRERAEFNAERQRMMSSMNANYNRLVDKTKMEKDNLINQYEVKIEKLRTANRQANEIKTKRNA